MANAISRQKKEKIVDDLKGHLENSFVALGINYEKCTVDDLQVTCSHFAILSSSVRGRPYSGIIFAFLHMLYLTWLHWRRGSGRPRELHQSCRLDGFTDRLRRSHAPTYVRTSSSSAEIDGLSYGAPQKFRRSLPEDTKFMVAKNSLMSVAVADNEKWAGLADQDNMTGWLFVGENISSGIKVRAT